jgi:rubrerythrin
MVQINSVDDALDFAIEQEVLAHHIYTEWAAKVKEESSRQTLQSLARDELFHKEKLMKVRAQKIQMEGTIKHRTRFTTLTQAQGPPQSPTATYEEVLIWALNAEKQAHDLYIALAKATSRKDLAEILENLALQEEKHYALLDADFRERRRSQILQGKFINKRIDGKRQT